MRQLINAEVMTQTIKLQQMGAKVHVIDSKLCYVNFDIGGFQIQYVYNVNREGNYFLERIKPYPLPLKEFESEQDVVEIIDIDIEQFKNALKSHNIETFVTLNRELHRTMKKFEDLFLYYNVPGSDVQNMLEKIQKFELEMEELKHRTERLYFRKDPDNL